jgi:hypothetical protein
MKKVYLLSLFIAICNLAISQALCDEQICIVKSDIYGKYSEQEISHIADAHRENVEKSGLKFDLSCQYPSFWVYNEDGRKIIKEAKSIGSTLYVAGDQRCNIPKSPKFVKIEYNGGQNYAVEDYNGDAVFFDKSFIELIIDKDLWCYGLPLEPTKYIKCKICGETYKMQQFKSKDGEVRTLYVMSSKCSNGKDHDNLELEDIGKCSVTEGRVVSTE